MKIRNALIAAMLFAMVCAGSTNALAITYVQEAPPPAIKETFVPKPGYFWMMGHYVWNVKASSYKWVPGKQVKMRNTQVWYPARWVKQREGWVMQKGQWISKKEMEARRQAVRNKQACGHKKGYKIGYRKSVWADEYDFGKK